MKNHSDSEDFFEVYGGTYCITHNDFALEGSSDDECNGYDSSNKDEDTCVLRDLFIRTTDRFSTP